MTPDSQVPAAELPVVPPGFTATQAYSACATLGGLARWWLTPEVLRAAQPEATPKVRPFFEPLPHPPLPNTVGACAALGVRKHANYHPGFVFPLCWDTDAGCRPPTAFTEFGEKVKGLLLGRSDFDFGRAVHPNLRLRVDVALPPKDGFLSGLQMAPESAWPAIAGGLYLAVHGVKAKDKPDERVMATGVWKDGVGFQEVHPDGLRDKLAAAARHGVKTVFVPEVQKGQARDEAPAGVNIGTLKVNEPNPVEALRDYLVALEAPPPKATTFEQLQLCAAYYHRLPLRSDPAAEYYWTHMLDEVARLARMPLRNFDGGDPPRVTHLVTFVSGAAELIPLAASILEHVKSVLVLHTEHEPPPNVITQLGKMNRRSVPRRVRPDDHELVGDITRHITEFTTGVPKGKVVLDITPGNSWQTVTADRAMRPGEWRFFLNPTYDPTLRRVTPGNERPVLWRVN